MQRIITKPYDIDTDDSESSQMNPRRYEKKGKRESPHMDNKNKHDSALSDESS
jgi:hypothetical protein